LTDSQSQCRLTSSRPTSKEHSTSGHLFRLDQVDDNTASLLKSAVYLKYGDQGFLDLSRSSLAYEASSILVGRSIATS
jgi:hypothetical protein